MKKIYLTLLAAMALTLGACSSSNDPDLPDPEPTPAPTPSPEPEPEPEPSLNSQGWVSDYSGVMLQGFSWDSYNESQWKVLEKQADELKNYIDLVWLPQSGKCLETTQVMGYMPYYYFNQNSSFGSEAELRSLITKFKAAGIGAIADVVVNHRNTEGWYTFPAETYKGVTYQMQSTDICKNDDGGTTATQAATDGVSLSQNNDEGTDFGGCRDIDHKSENVQKVIKAYLKYLKDDLGYTGFRYDMVKGFDGSHVADYNDATGVEYSVGEYWDGNDKIESWINRTNKKSAAFDFQFRYNVRDAVNGAANGKVTKSSDWSKLNSNDNLMHDANYRRYAVTFVENHDTQKRSESEQNDPLRKDTIAANAYMLAMPGTPCIFQPHWNAYKSEIKEMIAARKYAGITNMSNYVNKQSKKTLYVNEVAGTKHKLLVAVGNDAAGYAGETGYTKILSGYHYAYFLSNDAETSWTSMPSGSYEEGFKTTLTAVSQTEGAKLVYTLNGSTPTAKSTTVESGKEISINGTCTLKVGLLVNGEVRNIATHQYTIEKFKAYKFMVYVNADAVKWSPLYCYTWKKAASVEWPGEKMTETKTIGGKTWYYKEVSIDNATELVNVIFNNGTDKPQTVDITGLTNTAYFEIETSKEGKKYKVKDVTAEYNK
ncbi:alpha-amylase family glycosyl hydrolase [Segatella copri]|uniref:alpha-amylase family glycosyl hydrolase n=1 Tax=Segatella copri TaxID=165179 RepID=UPI00294AE7DA|nr:alpha-amylase family glycosyl hydrolase [Segatella copri]WOG31779.1 alpha-amylase family glycosyl hydrolase [Segatella copri]